MKTFHLTLTHRQPSLRDFETKYRELAQPDHGWREQGSQDGCGATSPIKKGNGVAVNSE